MWKYKNVTRKEFERVKDRVEELLTECGAEKTDIVLPYERKTAGCSDDNAIEQISLRRPYKYGNLYYRIDEIRFPEKPFIVFEKIMIPASATVIEEASIYWNYGLAAIEVDGNNKNYISDDGVLYTAQGKLLVSYPPASDRTEYTVMEGCERFGIYSLSQAMGLTELHAGEYLREIGDSALYGSSSLSEIGLPKGLQKINDSAFLFCDALTRVDFSGSSEDWSGIEIGEKNECLTDGSVEIHCAE